MSIAILAGSNRKKSTSTELCLYMERILVSKGCHVLFHDLYQYPIPFYCPENDFNDDANLLRMKTSVAKASAIILGTPEYHGGPSGVLKNALDHMGGEHFGGKAVLSVSSSGGAVGVSSLLQLQAIVRNVHGINCPEWISIGGGQRNFTEEGEPENPQVKERIHRVIDYFVTMSEKLSN